ncbi:hypothetical protein ES703_116404 [subsurface metagenome]
MGQPITLVKRGWMSAASPAGFNETLMAEEVDLGLSLAEAARILFVDLQGDVAPIAQDTGYLDVLVSFDPGDKDVAFLVDDNHFCGLRTRTQSGNATIEVIQTSVHRQFNFSGEQLITVRNLAMICRTIGMTGDAPAYNLFYVIHYEKYTPSAGELNQLIAWRR